jgi:hypothetical protein
MPCQNQGRAGVHLQAPVSTSRLIARGERSRLRAQESPAEPVCRAAVRIDPSRISGSTGGSRGATSATRVGDLLCLLSPLAGRIWPWRKRYPSTGHSVSGPDRRSPQTPCSSSLYSFRCKLECNPLKTQSKHVAASLAIHLDIIEVPDSQESDFTCTL